MNALHFSGYRRPDGRAGVRNHVLVVPTVICASVVAERIANAIDVTPGAKPRTEAPRARADAQPSIQGEASEVVQDEPTGEIPAGEEEAGARG